MFSPFQQIQGTMKFLVHEGLAGKKPEKRGDPLAPGTVIDGRYRIEECLGGDGTQRLYAVNHVRNEGVCPFCRLKLKETQGCFCNHCGAAVRERMFQMEALRGPIDPQLILRLLGVSHPGIAQIFDILSEESTVYLFSQYFHGVTLDRLEGMLTAEQIRRAGICLIETVEYLHAQGLCRMNLRPSNLKLVDNRPRLLSLSACRLKSDLPGKELDWVDREDFRRLLETLEQLAAEYVEEVQDEMLCRLLVALEEIIGKGTLAARDVEEALARL